MSNALIARNPTLARLRDEGYSIEIIANHLVLRGAPYVLPSREIAYGDFISPLTLKGDEVLRPSTHVIYFIGEMPCDDKGKPLASIQHGQKSKTLGGGLVASRSFSNKPAEGYTDEYEKLTTYITTIGKYAKAIDPSVDARTMSPSGDEADDQGRGDAPFVMADTASSRAGIAALTEAFMDHSVIIIGVGGTGSFVLDLLSKTRLRQITLVDGDCYSQHNAFRAPGVTSPEVIEEAPNKASYFASVYRGMHERIMAHPVYLTRLNRELLDGITFAFVCVDDAEARGEIFTLLGEMKVPFIDVGMDVERVDDTLDAMVRTCLSTPDDRGAEVHAPTRRADEGGEDIYGDNIQTAELNALNAALAVVAFKRYVGFYLNLCDEKAAFFSTNDHVLVRAS